MRGLKSTLALVVVLGGLGAYIYFVTSKVPEGGAPSEDSKKEKVFAALQADKIDEVRIATASGDATTLKKDGTAWKITQPSELAASESSEWPHPKRSVSLPPGSSPGTPTPLPTGKM